jgi:hypothetical protein
MMSFFILSFLGTLFLDIYKSCCYTGQARLYLYVCYSTPSDTFPMKHSTLFLFVWSVCRWRIGKKPKEINGDLMFASSIHCQWWKTHSSPYSPPSPDTCPPFSIFFHFIFFLKWYIRCYSLIILWLPSSSSLYTTVCSIRRDIERNRLFPSFSPLHLFPFVD